MAKLTDSCILASNEKDEAKATIAKLEQQIAFDDALSSYIAESLHLTEGSTRSILNQMETRIRYLQDKLRGAEERVSSLLRKGNGHEGNYGETH